MANKNVEDMSIEEVSRWGALIKAIEIIEENCETLGKRFDELDLKPIAIKHYINSLANNIQKDLEEEAKQKTIESQKIYEHLITKRIASSCEENGVLLSNNV